MPISKISQGKKIVTPDQKKANNCLKKLEALTKAAEKDNEISTNARIMTQFLPSKRNKPRGSDVMTSSSSSEMHSNAKALTNPEEIKDLYFGDDVQDLSKFGVKLLVTALSVRVPQSPGARIMGKLAKAIGITKLGSVHTAVHAGSQIIEWNDSSLVMPEPAEEFFNRKTLFAIDLELVDPSKKFDPEAVDKMCEVIARWNGSKTYGQVSANCQDFSTELLDALGMKQVFDKGSKIKEFLDKVDQMEKQEVQFEHTFEKSKETMVFRDHASLDIACRQQLGTAPNTATEEYRLLKAYDRVFWLRYYGYSSSTSLSKDEKKRLKELCEEHSESHCYFGDPAQTKTAYGKAYQEAQQIGDDEEDQ